MVEIYIEITKWIIFIRRVFAATVFAAGTAAAVSV